MYNLVDVVKFEAEIKKWGNSQGNIIPKKYAKRFSTNKVRVQLEEENPMKKHYGTLKLDVPIKQLMREIDEELWDE